MSDFGIDPSPDEFTSSGELFGFTMYHQRIKSYIDSGKFEVEKNM